MSEKYRIELSIKAKNDIKSIVLYIKNNLKEHISTNFSNLFVQFFGICS